MTAATTVTATFTLNQYPLTVSKTGTGSGLVSSSPSGIVCGGDCSQSYDYGTDVTLTAVADPGSTFMGWSGGGCTGVGTCVVTVNASTTVTATFLLNQYTLTVNKSGTGTGTVSSAPAGIDCGSTCDYPFYYNTSVTLSASPTGGSTFTGWSGSGCGGTGTCVVLMTAVHTVTATFASGGIGKVRVMPDSQSITCIDGTQELTCPTSAGTWHGQDGDYTINYPSVSTSTGIVIDNLTGLVWEQTYVSGVTQAAAVAHCTTLSENAFAGRTNWRLPTHWELTSISDIGKTTSVFYSEFGPPPSNTFFWTMSVVGSSAYAMSGNWNAMYLMAMTNSYVARCVSGSNVAADWRVGASGLTVEDWVTGLEWQRSSSTTTYDWAGALNYCESSTLDGHSDWRLPNLKELLSIVKPTASSPAIDSVFTNTQNAYYWSSSPLPHYSFYDIYAVSFSNGTSNIGTDHLTPQYVRCVRGTP